MQSLGFLYNLTTGVKKDKKKELIDKYKNFFNTHPYMSGYLIGATLRAYELKESPEETKKFINVGQSAFASLGDTLFWQTIRPALLLIAVIIGLKFGIIGPIIFLIVYNILHFYHRISGFLEGYKNGWDVIYQLKSKRILLTQRLFEIIGVVATGLLPVILTRDIKSLIFIPFTGFFLLLLIKKIPLVFILTIATILIIIMMLVPYD